MSPSTCIRNQKIVALRGCRKQPPELTPGGKVYQRVVLECTCDELTPKWQRTGWGGASVGVLLLLLLLLLLKFVKNNGNYRRMGGGMNELVGISITLQ
jgi:hypothetical protein